MLRYPLLHPPLLGALARCGHGSKILIADGNFPTATTASASAEVVYLNFAPGSLTILDVLGPVLSAINVESATMMQVPDGVDPDAQRDFGAVLGASVPISNLERFDFYEAVRSPEVGVIIATADERIYANLLLTVNLR